MAQGRWHRALAPSFLPPFLQLSLEKSPHSLNLLVSHASTNLTLTTLVAAADSHL